MLSSPLLGPAVWQPVVGRLAGRGWSVRSGAVRVAPRTPDDVLRAFLAELPEDRELILVPHSNAGCYVPALAPARPVVGYVFVDARLPDRSGRVRMGPESFGEFLGPKADADGLLPPWTRWWDGLDVAGLFPDRPTQARVEREQHRLPLSYFEQSLPVPAGWTDRPGAFLAFGNAAYAAELAQAREWGWPVVTLPEAEHLHLLIEPDQVAAQIESLAGRLGFTPDG